MRFAVIGVMMAVGVADSASAQLDGLDQARSEAERARRDVDRAAAEAAAQAAAAQASMAQEESQRLAAEARRRADLADDARRAFAADYARRRAESETQAQAARSEAELVRHAQEQRLRVAEEELRRLEAASGTRAAPAPAPSLPIYAPRGARAPAPTARRGPGADEVIAMKEGVVLCQRDRGTAWRCNGPVRVVFGDIDADDGAPAAACGRGPVRDLGSTGGMRAFGCGYGLNPWSAAPGNRDVAAIYGVTVRGRQTFRCPRRHEAFCETR